MPYRDAEYLLADLAGSAPGDTRRLGRLHDPGGRLEYLRAKAIGRLLENGAAVFLENEDAIIKGTFDDELLEQSPVAGPLQAILRLAKDTIYTARPALEIKLQVSRFSVRCWPCSPARWRRGRGMGDSRLVTGCCSSCCRPSFSAWRANPIPTLM
ncbi:MAG: hypothetical protein IPN75_17950, partial [Dechloromonas sp.]|nr:hypothetical protein [Candidatus Dechloromonas phosphorivorans]